MADAATDRDETDGMQTHRSWWAARHAVVKTHAINKRNELGLSNGMRVQIGRPFRPNQKQASWV